MARHFLCKDEQVATFKRRCRYPATATGLWITGYEISDSKLVSFKVGIVVTFKTTMESSMRVAYSSDGCIKNSNRSSASYINKFKLYMYIH